MYYMYVNVGLINGCSILDQKRCKYFYCFLLKSIICSKESEHDFNHSVKDSSIPFMEQEEKQHMVEVATELPGR
jgi:hypothetical protein